MKSNFITAFKALDKNFSCRGFAYQVGQTYTHSGKVVACNSGFHSCENPLDVLDYYPLSMETRFAIVKVGDSISRNGNKIASSMISLEAELRFPEFVAAAVKWAYDSCTKSESGDSIQLAASGDFSKLAASGYSSKLAASGDSSKLAASGESIQLAASGDFSQLAASGDSSQLAASGDFSKLAASGYYSKLAASGDSSQLAASGDSSQLAASGYSSKLAASGYSSKLAASGGNSIAVAVANKCRAMAGLGGCIALRWTDNCGRPRLAVAYIGENGIKAGVYYELDSRGNFVECAE